MKKWLTGLMLIILVGCAEKEEYKQAILEQMKQDKDINDYKIQPELITDCVIQTSSGNMPGLFSYDPERLKAYKNYTKMLTLNNSSDPKKTLEELRVDFGSPKNLAAAHAIYTESVMQCMEGIITTAERDLKDAKK